MCGIVGMLGENDVASELYDSLIHLQHRGQDAAGILTANERFYTHHGLGLVKEIFNESHILKLKGQVGIAHVRYPTAGGYSEADVQPLWIGNPRGIALAHNGNLVNYEELAADIRQKKCHLNSTLDSEILLHLLAEYLGQEQEESDSEKFFLHLCQAIAGIHHKVQGAYSVVSAVIGRGLIACRDPHGIRPLVYGSRKNALGKREYIFASETTPFYALGFEVEGDLKPGEVAYVDLSGRLFRQEITAREFRPCAFEYIYFARPDAILDEVSVYRSRLHLGQNLAKAWKKRYPHIVPDVIIPAPSTANTAALAFAHELNVRYSEGLYKNPFIGRTFIMSNQKARGKAVRYKLTPQKSEIANNKVLIVDDSVVRGTTSQEMIRMMREYGAKEVYLASTCPPILKPCFYGIDIPSTEELIAANYDESDIQQFLGVDYLLYQTQADLVEALTRSQTAFTTPCMACMDGHYICGNINFKLAKKLGKKRELERH